MDKLSGNRQIFEAWLCLNSRIIYLPRPSTSGSCTLSSDFMLKRPEKYFLSSVTLSYGDGPWFFTLFNKHEYTHGIFWSVILVSILQLYSTFSFFLKTWLNKDVLLDIKLPWIDRINSGFQRVAFQRNLLLIGF